MSDQPGQPGAEQRAAHDGVDDGPRNSRACSDLLSTPGLRRCHGHAGAVSMRSPRDLISTSVEGRR